MGRKSFTQELKPLEDTDVAVIGAVVGHCADGASADKSGEVAGVNTLSVLTGERQHHVTHVLHAGIYGAGTAARRGVDARRPGCSGSRLRGVARNAAGWLGTSNPPPDAPQCLQRTIEVKDGSERAVGRNL